MNSGGKMGILLEPWPKGKEFQVYDYAYDRLNHDGWYLWVPEGGFYGIRANGQYVIMEEWNLAHYEDV